MAAKEMYLQRQTSQFRSNNKAFKVPGHDTDSRGRMVVSIVINIIDISLFGKGKSIYPSQPNVQYMENLTWIMIFITACSSSELMMIHFSSIFVVGIVHTVHTFIAYIYIIHIYVNSTYIHFIHTSSSILSCFFPFLL